MNSQILDTPDYDFNEVRQKLLKAGLTDVYEKKGTIIVRKSEAVRVKIKNEGHGYQVFQMMPQIGNGAQALFSIIFMIIFIYVNIPLFFIAGIIAGFAASTLFYWPKCYKLKAEVEQVIRDHHYQK